MTDSGSGPRGAFAAALERACGPGRLSAAGPADAVGGVPAAWVVRPGDVAGVSAVLAAVSAAGGAAVVRGNGTKIDWGLAPRRLDVVIDVSALRGVVEHEPGDLVLRVAAATPLTEVAAVVAPHRQQLAIDEMVPGSSVGGVIATALAGPTRLRYGALRDLLIGITVVRPDGRVAHSGGKVVKNVAGYDLAKLYCGSYGTLGVIVEAAFRLHPLPQARRFVRARFDAPGELREPLARVRAAGFAPSACEVELPASGGVGLVVLLEGGAAGMPGRCDEVARALGASVTVSEQPPPGWSRLPGPILLKLTAEIAAVPDLLAALSVAARTAAVAVSVVGSAATGVLFAGLPGDADPAAAVAVAASAREACTAAGGFATVLRAPPAVRSAIDSWGPVNGLALMRRVKDSIDPGGVLAAGRFVGGL